MFYVTIIRASWMYDTLLNVPFSIFIQLDMVISIKTIKTR